MNEHPTGQHGRFIYFIVGVAVLLIIGGAWLADYNSPQKKLDRCVASEQKSGRWPNYTPMTMLVMCCQERLHQAPTDHSYLTC